MSHVDAEAEDPAADGAGDADLVETTVDLDPRMFAAIFCPVSATVLSSLPPWSALAVASFRSVELARAALDRDVPAVEAVSLPLPDAPPPILRLHSFPDESTRYEYLLAVDPAPEPRDALDSCFDSFSEEEDGVPPVPRMRFSTLAFRGRSGSRPEEEDDPFCRCSSEDDEEDDDGLTGGSPADDRAETPPTPE